MANNIQSVRGMRDIHSQDAIYWSHLEGALRQLASSYGYQYIKFPIVEKTALFKRSIGLVTDIVEKEMYTFESRGGESLSLRPEGTAVCVRAGISQGILYNQKQKLWYMGPMFRHERPQKDRYRQFEQFGLEIFGISTPDVEVELILFCVRLWEILGIKDHLKLNINTLGTADVRKNYRDKVVTYFKQHLDILDEDSLNRLETNPLRILDTKNPAMLDVVNNAPKLIDNIDSSSLDHFTKLQDMLTKLNVEFTIKPTLVRGLDYYNDTVFEWSTTLLGAQSEVCAGGRYDGLVKLLGGHDCPAIGFAIGLDRIVSLMQQADMTYNKKTDVYILSEDDDARIKALELAEHIRRNFPKLLISVFMGSGNLKKQFKETDKNNTTIVAILGSDEVKNSSVSVKFLNEDTPQTMYTMQEFDNLLQNKFGNV